MSIEIGVRIQQTLDRQNLSQRELARRLKVSPSTLRGWLVNSSVLNPQQLNAIANALGIDYRWLLSGVSENQPTVLTSPLYTPRVSPSLAQIYMDRGELYFSLGLNEEALAQFKQALSEATTLDELNIQIRALIRAAQANIRLGALDLAWHMLSQARMVIIPELGADLAADALLSLANLEFRKGNFETVRSSLEEAFILLNDTTPSLLHLKRRYWEIKASYAHAYERWEEAIHCYEQIPPLDVPFEEQYNLADSANHAIMLIHVGRHPDAIERLEKVIKSLMALPNSLAYQYYNALAHWGLGLAYEEKKEWSKALFYYLESCKISESSEAIVGSARCMKALNSSLLKITLEKGLKFLSKETATAYLDYAPEWLFMIEMLGERAKIEAIKWVDAMIKIVPLNFWQTSRRATLLRVLDLE